MATNQEFLDELAKRTGATVEGADLANLDGKNPEDVAAYKAALEAQYQTRGASGGDRNAGGYNTDLPDDPAARAAAQSPASSATPAQSWNGNGGILGGLGDISIVPRNNSGSGGILAGAGDISIFPNWYQGMMQKQQQAQSAAQQAAQEKADALYSTLNQRATQGLTVNASDPAISGQVTDYSAQQERARRTYLDDTAEQRGPLANIQGERRMTAESVGQGTAAFQAQLIGQEYTARRNEIAQALATQGAMLSADQTRNLQAQLAQYDQAIQEVNAQTGARSVDNQFSLGTQGLDLQRTLGLGGLNLQQQGINNQTDQFLRELALRQWDLSNRNDYNWASLGA